MANHPSRSKAAKQKAAVQSVPDHDHEHDYSDLLDWVRGSFDSTAKMGPLFQTDATGLNDIYLDHLPSHRQVHNCTACRRFIETYGGLAAVDDFGELMPAMWLVSCDAPDFYVKSFIKVASVVRSSRIVSPFRTSETTWGKPETGPWRHLSVIPPSALIYGKRALTAGQAMAAARENFITVKRALSDFTAPKLDELLRLLKSEQIDRGEKLVGPAQWLRDLHDRPRGCAGENLLWRAVATAPEGYCHPRASVLGPLLEDISNGLSFETIRKKHAAKVAPLRYQRPQAAPSAGNVAAAERLVEKLGLAPSLARRFARLDDVRCITWSPHAVIERETGGSVFGHLKTKGTEAPSVALPSSVMTWDKFKRTVIPTAHKIELLVPSHGRFVALTTAVDPDAPPILKWDCEEERNPVAWYVYPTGSNANQWGLRAGNWTNVAVMTPFPNLWGSRPMPFLSDGVVLVLEGCRDSQPANLALFPECLRDDLHGARATIEAHSRSGKLAGYDEASACGYDLRKSAADCTLRVHDGKGWAVYKIDRWD